MFCIHYVQCIVQNSLFVSFEDKKVTLKGKNRLNVAIDGVHSIACQHIWRVPMA